MPVVYSPVDPRVLYLGSNSVLATRDGGHHWQALSGDLTRPAGPAPACLGAFTPLDPEHGSHRGVVYTIAPSPRTASLVWAGTDDGLVHLTHDGGRTWRNVTPSALTPWSKVSMLEASHFDTLVAYAAINRFRLDDVAPHVAGGRRRHRAARSRERGAGGSGRSLAPLRRDRAHRVRVVRCGGPLAVPAPEPPGHLRARPRRA